jgi:hypothetical protein
MPYPDDVQIYTSCESHCIKNCIRNMNMDLDQIHQWNIEKCLTINPEKSQALLVNPYIIHSPIVSPLLLGSIHITFVDKVKKLGIIFNQELNIKVALDVFKFHTSWNETLTYYISHRTTSFIR